MGPDIIVSESGRPFHAGGLQYRPHLELKLDDDLTIDDDRRPKAQDADASSRLDAARVALARGGWATGFAEFKQRSFASPSDRPCWSGARSPAARIVVFAEERECDTLAFARFLPELAARALSLTLAAPAELLARLSPFIDAFGGVPMVDVACLPPHDLILPLASAPAALGLLPDQVPPPRVFPLERKTEGSIGIALTPSPWDDGSDALAEGVLTALLQAFPTFRLVALDRAASRLLGGPITATDPAVLASLDLVVATDGAVAHAAGVVGAPLWLLLGNEPHWMWGCEGRFSRWYPSARLFRPEGRGSQGLIQGLVSEARALASPGLSSIAPLNRLAAAAEGVEGAPAARAALPFAARLAVIDRANPEAWARLAGLLLRLGETADADRVLDAGLSAGPRHARLLLLAARRDVDRGRPAQALQHADLALVADPASIEALLARAEAFTALGEAARAEFAIRQAVQAAPQRADLLEAWGEALRRVGDARGAARAFERAAIADDSAGARLGLGRLAATAGNAELALHFLKTAVARDSGHVEAAMELARALSAANRSREAAEVIRNLIARRPSPAARAFLGELLLALGNFGQGLAEFEWRRGELFPLPSLADLAGKKLMLEAEGNASTVLRFLRFLPALKAANVDSIKVAGAPELLPLLSGMDGIDAPGGAEEGDLVLPMMSLPALLGLTAADLSAPRGYLAPDSVAVTTAARAFAHLSGFRVGLALDGLAVSTDIGPLSALSGMAWVALDAEANGRFPEAWPLVSDRSGLDKIAAALPNIDAVIATADSPVAALAGALGRPTFVIGPDRDDWLWLEQSGRTPWFTAMRLFRRRPKEEEAEWISRLVAALVAFANGDRAIPFAADDASTADLAEAAVSSFEPNETLVRIGLEALKGRDDYRAVLLLGDAVASGGTGPELREKLAAALLRIGEPDRAGALLSVLVAEAPTAERLVALSEACRLKGRLEESLAHAERAVELRPDLARAHRAVGQCLVALGRAADALSAYERAVSLAPNDPELLMDEAEALLIAGDYRRGFARAEVRWRAAELLPRRFSTPRWTGEDLGGRTLLVHGERDLGLDIAFARFLPQLVARGPQLVLEVRPALTDLFRRLELTGSVTVVEQGRRLPSYDLEVPLRSLPCVFGTERSGLPPPASFRLDPLRIEAWRQQFRSDGRPAIGLYWRDAEDAALLAPLADLTDARLFALDRRAGRASLAALPKGLSVEPLGARLGGFVETAAAMSALDAVIAPISTTAHLAATLGRPTFVAHPPTSDWFWTGESGTPWYPNARIWRLGDDLVELLRGIAPERAVS